MIVQFARNLLSRKPLGVVLAQAGEDEGGRRAAVPVRPVVHALGAMIGGGVFLVMALVAAHHAGPGVVLSVLSAALVCALAALAYAELASTVPAPASMYGHAYAALGELPAWLVGWSLTLAQVLAAATAAAAWSGYFTSLLEGFGVGRPGIWSSAPFASDGVDLTATGALMNMTAVAIIGAMGLFLVSGVRQGGALHTLIVALKVLALLIVIAAGASWVEPARWGPLLSEGAWVPQGAPAAGGAAGVATGAALMVLAFLGFERIWTVQAPGAGPRQLARSALVALAACTLLVVLTAVVVLGLVGAAAMDARAPLAAALAAVPGPARLRQPLDLLAVIALGSAVLGLLHAQSRLFLAMARDRLIPDFFTQVHPHTGALTVATVLSAWLAGLAAAFLPVWLIAALASAAALLALTVICAGVVWLRLAHPKLPRAFRTPAWWLVAPLGLFGCLYLGWSLGRLTLLRLLVWVLLGLVVYFLYGYRRSLHHRAEPAEDEAE